MCRLQMLPMLSKHSYPDATIPLCKGKKHTIPNVKYYALHIISLILVSHHYSTYYNIWGSFTCAFISVIYTISCLQCPSAVCIGQMRQLLHERMNGHQFQNDTKARASLYELVYQIPHCLNSN